MDMNTSNRGLMSAAVAIAILLGGWYYFRAKPAAAPLVGGNATSSSANVYELSAADNGKTVTYPVSSRFSVVLDASEYPESELVCTPSGILGRISNAPASPPGSYAVRFEAVKAGSCVLKDRGFQVTIRVTDGSGEGAVVSPAESVIRGYYDALNDKKGGVAHSYLSQEFGARLDAARSQEAADSLNSIVVRKTTAQAGGTDTKMVFEVVLEVSPKAGSLTSFSRGENIRLVELIYEKGAWKIAKITKP
jgi:hypothetical protein